MSPEDGARAVRVEGLANAERTARFVDDDIYAFVDTWCAFLPR